MSELATLSNNRSGERVFMSHKVSIPPMCPVSKNPRPGSTITICYRAKEQVLEVASLCVYLYRFIGGLRGPDGSHEVRDMEGMLARVASDCAQALGVPVRLRAHLLIVPKQEIDALVWGYPERQVAS